MLLGGIILACIAGGSEMFAIGVVLLYHFATNEFYAMPYFSARVLGIEALSGIPLVFCGGISIFIVIMFIVAAVFMVRVIGALNKRDKKSSQIKEQSVMLNL